MIDKLQTAWLLAARHHEGQRYSTPVEGQTLPYLTHLGAVLLEAQNAVRHEPGLDAELMLLCAILHDTIEDTDLQPENIRDAFGERVLAGVLALTKDESLPTKREQMKDSLSRILAQPPEIAAVKLCDRINNLSPPPHYWDAAKVAAYKAEAELILERLGGASTYLAGRLSTKIAAYGIQ